MPCGKEMRSEPRSKKGKADKFFKACYVEKCISDFVHLPLKP